DETWSVDTESKLLAGQTVRLERGFMELRLLNGIVVVIEGPAEFTLTSTVKGVLEYGGLAVRVPPGEEGYVVDTPTARLTDLGTEFAVVVGSSGDEVHVLDGQVRLEPRAGTLPAAGAGLVRTLRIGQALRTDLSGSTRLVGARPVEFLGRQRLAELASRESTNRVAKWQAYRAELEADQGVLLNYG
ncbi:MAG: FecR domain-containing protein, partial [Planctomycetota bacterium]